MKGKRRDDVVILGAGLAGLSAGHALSDAERQVAFVEAGETVGGMSRTEVRDGFRFDLGGHRFFTNDREVEKFVLDLMGAEMLTVPRKSTIILRGKRFDYPLKPFNAIFGLGWRTTAKILFDYGLQRLKRGAGDAEDRSLEDKVVRDFGRTLFNIYFKEYSEKVWGITCDRISAEWVAQRIKGLSLSMAVKNALFKMWGKDIPTLADHFYYPSLGIGRIADRLLESIGDNGTLHAGTRVTGIYHQNGRVERVEAENHRGPVILKGEDFISTIPVTAVIDMLRPRPPEHVRRAAESLRYRDLVVVALQVHSDRVTDQSWIYVPEKKIPFGRLHEPKNWSPLMAVEGTSVLVAEYFCFNGDDVWNSSDADLIDTTITHLDTLGIIDRKDAGEGSVVRVPKAYPLFEVGYFDRVEQLLEYLNRFRNFFPVGRNGLFQYYNMDHTIESGLEAAKEVLGKTALREGVSQSIVA